MAVGKVFSLFGATSLFGLSALFVPNYSRVCLPRLEILSNAKLIEIASRDDFNGYPPSSYMLTGEPVQDPVQYLSYEDYMARNPDCCTVTDEGREGLNPTLFHRLMGRFAGFVRIEYIVEDDGVEKPKTNVAFVAVTNCGNPWNGVRYRQ